MTPRMPLFTKPEYRFDLSVHGELGERVYERLIGRRTFSARTLLLDDDADTDLARTSLDAVLHLCEEAAT